MDKSTEAQRVREKTFFDGIRSAPLRACPELAEWDKFTRFTRIFFFLIKQC